MKVFIPLCALIACCLAASEPNLVPVSTYRDSIIAAGPSARIVNGFPATANQIPYQCSVLSPVGGGFTVCGCSIISTTWTLTAAHCTIGNTQFNLRFGSLGLQTGGFTQTSFNSISHPFYNPANLNNDVSLVQIPTALDITAAVAPIQLAALSHIGTTFIGVQSRVSGWGQTHLGPGVSQTLNWVWMNPIPNAQCAGVYGAAVIAGHVICALGWDAPDQGHCGGDSGGPLAIHEGDVWTQIGVVSFGAAAGCTLGFPHGYMRTAEFATWVAGHTGIVPRA